MDFFCCCSSAVLLCKYFAPLPRRQNTTLLFHTKTQDLVHTLLPSKSRSLPLVRQKSNHRSFLSWFQPFSLPHTLSLFCREAFLHWLCQNIWATCRACSQKHPTSAAGSPSPPAEKNVFQVSKSIVFIPIFNLRSLFQQPKCLKTVTLGGFPCLYAFTKNYLLVKTGDR